MSEQTATTLRLPKNLLDRAERLVSPMATRAKQLGELTTTRSDVLRLALARGLLGLEVEYGTRRRK